MSALDISGNFDRYLERSATLAYLYRRFWAIAALHRAGRFSNDAADAAAIEQRMICLLFEEISQGLHQVNILAHLPDATA